LLESLQSERRNSSVQEPAVQVNAKVDYALRALAELATVGEGPMKAEAMARAQGIPPKFLENILLELRHAGIVISQRGAEGGYRLGRPANEITLADVIRVVDGPLANVRGLRPETLEYTGPATALLPVWIALRANMRAVLERVTLADLVRGELPPEIVALTASPDAWSRRSVY
jgi:Rrf2 family protein